MAVPFCIPTNNESSCCSTFPAFGVISVLDFKHSNSGVVISHGCLNLYFPDGMWCVEHLFKCLFAICLSSFLGYLTLFFSRLFTFLLLKLKSSLYILDCILYQMCPLQRFSPVSSLHCLSQSRNWSFDKVQCNKYFCVDCAFTVASEKSLPMMAFRWNLSDCL